jgi:hypothetical protein
MPMEVPLEDIPEYEKYRTSIKNIDKIIEKIASISNIPHLMKSETIVKLRRKSLVKNIIDLLLINNSVLKPVYKERRETLINYGINKELSDLFFFDLDNSIFLFSSKDIDKFKPIKTNNIVGYITFIMILEINDSHISYLGNDKKSMCNFNVFDKIFHYLFDGLKIRINNKGDLKPITNYKILCYLLYIIGCSVVKYNLWYNNEKIVENKENEKSKGKGKMKQEANMNSQKIFISTIVDLINSVLEFSSNESSKSHIYEMISVKTYKKLGGMFGSDELYKKLQNEYKTSGDDSKKDFILSKTKLIKLSGTHTEIEYADPIVRICKMPTLITGKKIYEGRKLFNINNISNCKDGNFHKFEFMNGTHVCKNCSVKLNTLQYDEKETLLIKNNFKYVRLINLSKQFCNIDGFYHNFEFNIEKNISVCLKCKNEREHVYTEKELDILEKIIDLKKNDIIMEENKNIKLLNENVKKENDYNTKVVEHVKTSYNKYSDMKFIDELINELSGIVGNVVQNESNILNLNEIHLKENSYIIDHNHLGQQLDQNIVLSDVGNKVMFKENHQFFNTDVIYYVNNKNGKINVFYDASTKILLGYKEESKNFVSISNQDKKLIVNYSILNKLKMMGYESEFINIEEPVKKLLRGLCDIENEKNNNLIDIVISNISRDRIVNLKKVIIEFQKIFCKLLNVKDQNFEKKQNRIKKEQENNDKYQKKEQPDITIMSGLYDFIEKNKNTLLEISVTDGSKNHMVFKHWKGVVRGIYSKELKFEKYNGNQKIINYDDVNKLDDNGNMILLFIVSELTKLLKYNSKHFTKIITAEFIINFINCIFEMFNNEKIINNIDVKKFNCLLNSVTYIQNIAEKNNSAEFEGIYGEYVDENDIKDEEYFEEVTDNQGEVEGFDMEDEYADEEGIAADQFESDYEAHSE